MIDIYIRNRLLIKSKQLFFLTVIFITILIILIAGVKKIAAKDKYLIEMNDDFWKSQLTAEEFSVLVKEGTEPAFENQYYDNKKEGIYVCAACGNRLFFSEHKYKSGTGWPSFYEVISKNSVGTRKDNSLLTERTEVYCQRCGGHLGHVFKDGPDPTGLRYCMNSNSLKFLQTANLAMGCFWKPEALFGSLTGVYFTEVGYAGGDKKNPTYHNLGNHTETVQIIYNPEVINYKDLLGIFWDNHSPTQRSYSTQYKSIIFYRNDGEKSAALRFLKDKKEGLDQDIYVDVKEIKKFYPAEKYHQKYLIKRNKELYQKVNELFSDKYTFENSQIAARLNAYSANFLAYDELKEELRSFYLYVKNKEKIEAIIAD